MHPDLEDLCSDVDEIVAILRAHNMHGWARALEKGASEIRLSDFHGVIRILHCYGGMGTLNDIIIYERDGRLFDALRTRIYQKADVIRAEENILARAGFSPLT